MIFLGHCCVWRYFAGILVTNISWEICSMQIQTLFWDGNKKQPVQCQEMVHPCSNRSTVPYFYSFYQNISKNQRELSNLWQKLWKYRSFSFISSTALEGSMEYYDSESSSILRRTNPFLTKFYHENLPVVSRMYINPDVLYTSPLGTI